MTSRTVTLDLPQDVYERAERMARVTERPLTQVIVSWITPPPSTPDEMAHEIADLEKLSDEDLIRIAGSGMPEYDVIHLQGLLDLQRERGLDEVEQREAAALVEREDWYTLRRARALYLLKKRNMLPGNLRELLDETAHGIHPSRSTS